MCLGCLIQQILIVLMIKPLLSAHATEPCPLVVPGLWAKHMLNSVFGKEPWILTSLFENDELLSRNVKPVHKRVTNWV